MSLEETQSLEKTQALDKTQAPTNIPRPSDQVQPTVEDQAAGWIDIWVLLHAETCSLEASVPELPIPAGRPIRWRFRQVLADGSFGPLPKGWTPMVGFTKSSKNQADSPFGPFGGLLHVAADGKGTDGKDGVSVDIVGEWSPGALADDAPRQFHGFAMIHRGMGMESDRAFSCLTTPRLTLTLGPPDGLRYRASPTPEQFLVELSVKRDPKDPHRLSISPETPIKAFTNTIVRWQFAPEIRSGFPLILFYHSVELPKGAAVVLGDRNEHFEPCRKARFSPKGVEMWDFKTEPRSCFYEGAMLGLRALSLELLSTGDPQLDNQGIPFPLASGDGEEAC